MDDVRLLYHETLEVFLSDEFFIFDMNNRASAHGWLRWTDHALHADQKDFMLNPRPVAHPHIFLIPNQIALILKPPRLHHFKRIRELWAVAQR